MNVWLGSRISVTDFEDLNFELLRAVMSQLSEFGDFRSPSETS